MEENLALATRNIAAGLGLNWGANWDQEMRDEVIGHLLKVARALEAQSANNQSPTLEKL